MTDHHPKAAPAADTAHLGTSLRVLGEMSIANPGIGSFTEYTRIGLGNWAGFTNGWLYGYFWVIVVAVEAVAGAGILQRWIPAPATHWKK